MISTSAVMTCGSSGPKSAASRLRVSVIAAHFRAGQFYRSIGLAISNANRMMIRLRLISGKINGLPDRGDGRRRRHGF
jgi:hypothetical protein